MGIFFLTYRGNADKEAKIFIYFILYADNYTNFTFAINTIYMNNTCDFWFIFFLSIIQFLITLLIFVILIFYTIYKDVHLRVVNRILLFFGRKVATQTWIELQAEDVAIEAGYYSRIE